ncbi:MAG: hypothetical protein A4E19_03305 [Nitrospira sp. SG-bin1]|nr:MAG: hypothetical protein A4E19_03305 [Nitrospira sp. SG-bin1]
MATETIETIENVPWESDEAEDWESDEAIAEVEDSAEDIGERARRRVMRRGRTAYLPGRGVSGMVLRGRDGKVPVRFPAPLATTRETNVGFARQELARRRIEEGLDRLEARLRVQQKNESSVSGLVTLTIGGGLTAFGAIQAAGKQGGSLMGRLAAEPSTRTAAVVSAAQLATSGAKLVINGRYHRSGIGITADIFSAAQLALFAFGSLSTPREYKVVVDRAAAVAAMANDPRGTLYLTEDNSQVFQLEIGANNRPALRLVS